MRLRTIIGLTSLAVAVMATTAVMAQAPAQPPALTGKVTSQAEGAMEGVGVTAQRDGSNIMVSVYTNAQGQYAFPGGRLDPGSYTVTIRAAGYVLPGNEPQKVQVNGSAPAQLDLTLTQATTDQLAHQLTNLDWVNSFPGTSAEKDMLVRNIVNCGFCHTLERVARAPYTADEWIPVIQRMITYAPDNTSGCGTGSTTSCDGASDMRIQVSAATPPAEGLAYRNTDAKTLAEYLAKVDLGGGKSTWDYQLKPMARPTGKATQVIATTYIAPRQPSVIHDLSVDSKGNVWYGDSGWGYLSKLDPKTGKVTEYQAPNQRPPAPADLDRVVGVQDVQVDTNDNVWAVLGGPQMAMFDTKAEKWVLYSMPGVTWAFITPFRSADPNTVWTTDRTAGTAPLMAQRLNIATGKVDASHPIMVGPDGKDLSQPQPIKAYALTGTVAPFCYQIDRDLKDNFICDDYYGSNIITVDAQTGARKVVPTPTPNAAPRRGRLGDSGQYYWFSEFWGDNVGRFDVAAGTIKEFPAPVKYMSPYSVVEAKNGEAWASSNGSDRLLRINPTTGETTAYLMPVYYDARKVEVDRSAPNTTIWLPNKNLSELIRVEPLN